MTFVTINPGRYFLGDVSEFGGESGSVIEFIYATPAMYYSDEGDEIELGSAYDPDAIIMFGVVPFETIEKATQEEYEFLVGRGAFELSEPYEATFESDYIDVGPIKISTPRKNGFTFDTPDSDLPDF